MNALGFDAQDVTKPESFTEIRRGNPRPCDCCSIFYFGSFSGLERISECNIKSRFERLKF
jgi:hypothetical protein